MITGIPRSTNYETITVMILALRKNDIYLPTHDGIITWNIFHITDPFRGESAVHKFPPKGLVMRIFFAAGSNMRLNKEHRCRWQIVQVQIIFPIHAQSCDLHFRNNFIAVIWHIQKDLLWFCLYGSKWYNVQNYSNVTWASSVLWKDFTDNRWIAFIQEH